MLLNVSWIFCFFFGIFRPGFSGGVGSVPVRRHSGHDRRPIPISSTSPTNSAQCQGSRTPSVVGFLLILEGFGETRWCLLDSSTQVASISWGRREFVDVVVSAGARGARSSCAPLSTRCLTEGTQGQRNPGIPSGQVRPGVRRSPKLLPCVRVRGEDRADQGPMGPGSAAALSRGKEGGRENRKTTGVT